MTVDHEKEQAAAVFKMPQVTVGQQVFWYERGLSNAAPAAMTVTRIYDRRIEGRFLSGNQTVVCPHMTDPTLDINEHHREEGAWDWTDAHKEQMRERAFIKQQLHTLQVEVAALKARLDGKKQGVNERMAAMRAKQAEKRAQRKQEQLQTAGT